jgi:hypothetical protein
MPRWWPSPRRWRRARFRILEKKRLKGLQFDQQAAAIREMAGRYRVTRIAIDTTGAGKAVEQLVRKWFRWSPRSPIRRCPRARWCSRPRT